MHGCHNIAQYTHRGRNKHRDAVSNGRLLPKGVDLRSVEGRGFLHLVESYTAELGGSLSEVERVMVKQCAAISMRCEVLQAKLVAGEDVDTDDIIRLTSESRRILSDLKAKTAKNKPAGPSLQDFLAQRATRASDPEAADS